MICKHPPPGRVQKMWIRRTHTMAKLARHSLKHTNTNTFMHMGNSILFVCYFLAAVSFNILSRYLAHSYVWRIWFILSVTTSTMPQWKPSEAAIATAQQHFTPFMYYIHQFTVCIYRFPFVYISICLLAWFGLAWLGSARCALLGTSAMDSRPTVTGSDSLFWLWPCARVFVLHTLFVFELI